jgi:hypothetical protein
MKLIGGKGIQDGGQISMEKFPKNQIKFLKIFQMKLIELTNF